MLQQDDIVLSGFGALTPRGLGLTVQLAALDDDVGAKSCSGSLAGFQAAKHLSDKRIMKAISFRDALGLVAFEDCTRQARYAPGSFAPERIGLYIGAPPSSALDAIYYEQAMRTSRTPSGSCDFAAFGKACGDSKPTALLIGLPNNVLCYGSILLDARGPNSNYTSGAVSGLVAVLNAARRVARGQVDFAVAGGYGMPSNELYAPLLARLGVAACGSDDGVCLADGAVFMALERRGTAAERDATPLATYLGGATTNAALGPYKEDEHGQAQESAMRAALRNADVDAQAVGLVLASPGRTGKVEAALGEALTRIFSQPDARPAVGMLRNFGHRMESSGLLEIGVVRHLYERGRLPHSVGSDAASASGFSAEVSRSKPFALVLASTASGEHACLIVRMDHGVSQ